MPLKPDNTIGVYVAEEQEFYRQIYKTSFESDCSLRFLGVSSNGDIKTLNEVISIQKPDVIIMGARKIAAGLINEMEAVYSRSARTNIVLLITSLEDVEARAVRKLIQKARRGIGVYLKQSLDNPRQLHDIIKSVSQGQIVLDPSVANTILMERAEYPFMKDLTDREMEILNLLAQGHTNQGIARVLCIDVKTVAHHLNNVYSKLKYDSELDQKHPRVSVARIYLETTGELMPVSSKNAVQVN